MTMTAEAQLLDIIRNKKTSKDSEIFDLYDQLQPVEPEFLFGEWSGDPVETGHQTSKWCSDVNFAGKTFHSRDNVQPVFVFDKTGARKFFEDNGYAQIREVKHRGVVTSCLIYDGKPIFDYFRRIDDNTVIAAAENKMKEGTFFFYLRRGQEKY